METTKEEATDFFIELFQGKHHIPSEIKPFGSGWIVSCVQTLATYDFNNLTWLVLLAHEKCFRAEVMSGAPNRIRIAIFKRQREGRMFERHPTIEEAIKEFNK